MKIVSSGRRSTTIASCLVAAVLAVLLVSARVHELVQLALVGQLDLQEPAAGVRLGVDL